MILFPAIDLKEGLAVRLQQGDMARATVFHRDPAAQAREFEMQGFKHLHVVDLDGAFAGKPMNGDAVDRILETVGLCVQLGGGIRDMATVEAWLDKGVNRVIIGTAAVRNPALVKDAAKKYPGKIAVGLDARDGKVAVQGWAEISELSALDHRTPLRGRRRRGHRLYRRRARRHAEGSQSRRHHRAGRCDLDPGDRVGRPGLDRRHQGAARAARAASCKAPSPAARSMTGGSTRRKRSSSFATRGRRPRAMFKVRVIPCLDVKDGRVVKGVNFVNLRDAGDPVEAAIAYDAAGADELCFLDITASHENRGIILDVVRRTAEACFMPLTVGGGVRTIEDIRALLTVGRRQGLDQHRGGEPARLRQGGGGEIRRPVHRGRDRRQAGVASQASRRAGKSSPMAGASRPASTRSTTPRKWSRSAPARSCSPPWTATAPGAASTSRSPSAVADAVTVPVIASGGVGTLDHMVEGIRDGHATAVLAASIFHFGEHSVREAKHYMAKAGLPMRLDA